MDRIFVDSWFWIALADKNDNGHKRCVKLLKSWVEARQLLTTSNFVLDESFTTIRKRGGVSRLEKFRDRLAELEKVLHTERVVVQDEEMVWKWILFDWRELSYTDCTSFAVMKRLGFKMVATDDKHFEMAGFEIIKS